MSFVFRGTRGDIESGFPGFIPERPAVVCSCLLLYFGTLNAVTMSDYGMVAWLTIVLIFLPLPISVFMQSDQ